MIDKEEFYTTASHKLQLPVHADPKNNRVQNLKN